MRILPSGEAPPWLAHFAREIEKAIRGPRDAPLQLKAYANAAALPEPAEWPFGIVHVTDIAMVAISTGSAWKRIDTGATL